MKTNVSNSAQVNVNESSYQKQANEFAANFGVKLSILDEDYRPYFPEDKQSRSVYKCKLTRNGKSYTFDFGQSIACTGEKPKMYSILSCLTKYDPETFEDFCANFGYDEDSRTAERTYKAVCKEFAAVERLFGDILEELAEIN